MRSIRQLDAYTAHTARGHAPQAATHWRRAGYLWAAPS